MKQNVYKRTNNLPRMENISDISELLKLDFFEATLVDTSDNNTTITLNKEKGYGIISIGHLKLEYDYKKITTFSEPFIKKQNEIHKDYIGAIKDYLITDYKEVRDYEQSEENLSEISPTGLKIVKLFEMYDSWKKGDFKSLKSHSIEKIETEKNVKRAYCLQQVVLEFGNKIIEKAVNSNVPENVKNDLNEWHKNQKELVYLMGRLIDNSNKRIKTECNAYKILFPNSKIILENS